LYDGPDENEKDMLLLWKNTINSIVVERA